MGVVHQATLAEAFARASGLDLWIVMGLEVEEVDDTPAGVLGRVRHGSAAVDTAHCLSPTYVVEPSLATLAVSSCRPPH